MFDLLRFSLGDMIKCGHLIRQSTAECGCMEDAANEILKVIYTNFRDSDTGKGNFVLVRFFKTHRFGLLPEELKQAALERSGATCNDKESDKGLQDDTNCLTLLSTYGVEEAWNKRQTSEGHQVIPLYSVSFVNSLPMVSALLSQLGVDIHDVVHNNTQRQFINADKTYGVFYVYDATSNPLVPAQEGFVIPYGVKSVLGFGGELPNGEIFAVMMFCGVYLSDDIADMFKTLALSVQYAIVPFKTSAFRGHYSPTGKLDSSSLYSRVYILSNLMRVTEEMALLATTRLDDMVSQQTMELKESYRTQGVINSILSLSLSPMSLEAQLQEILELLLSVSWFALEPVGSISIVEDEKEVLVLKASVNFNEHLLSKCRRIPFNRCLCGIAAYTKQIVFSDCIDERHETTYPGILEHGHYCVPIMLADGSVLGVVNLYVRSRHKRSLREEEFLSAIAKTIAGIIERKRMEDMLRLSNEQLEEKVMTRNIDMVMANARLEVEVKNHKNARKKLKHNYQIQQTINSILEISLRASSLDEILREILTVVVSIPWISLESKACVFLVDDNKKVLRMYSSYNFNDEHLKRCKEISFGQCLCGKAALQEEIVFSSGLHSEPHHDIAYSGIQDHGHYCVPIKYQEKVIGVFTVFTKEGHKRKQDDETILLALTNTLAGVIMRYSTEDILREREEHLRSVIRTSVTAIISIDTDGRIAFWNDGASNIFGYSADEVIGRDLSLIIPERFRDDYRAGLSCQFSSGPPPLATGETCELIGLNKAGVEFPIELSLTRWSARSGTFFTGIIRDITRRKNAISELEQSLNKLRGITGAVIEAMSVAVEVRDPYTAGHQRRVADLARSIAHEMGLSNDQRDGLRVAAEIHDLGKISVPAEILSKAGKLKPQEFEIIKDHSDIGYNILKGIDFPYPVADIVLQHHEKLNGSGYPRGLSGEDILIEARIICVADVVEAMANHRPYRPALGLEKAFDEINTNSGTLYDPDVVQACMRAFSKGFAFKH
ncbi:protein containing PAS [Candidatus Magnetobacterium bavaricum]|nr:protein containing PAS [Candidatus Magnetobacterium bavaricum]